MHNSTLVGVVYSLVCNIKKINDTLSAPIRSFSLFLDVLISVTVCMAAYAKPVEARFIPSPRCGFQTGFNLIATCKAV